MQLKWLKEIRQGDLLYQYAKPTIDFWKAWRGSSESLANSGITLFKDETDGWIVRRVSSISGAELENAGDIPEFINNDTSKLMPYQIEPVSQICASLLKNRVAFDASDTGTGKTFTSLKAMQVLGLRPAIVCTKNAIRQWKEACKFFGLNPLFIINWESTIGRVYKNDGRIKKIAPPKNPYIKVRLNEYRGDLEYFFDIAPASPICVIFDEIHKANGANSSASALVYAAKSQGLHICGLSATLLDRVEKFRMMGILTETLRDEKFLTWMKENGCFIDKYERWQAVDEKNLILKINKYMFPRFGARVKKDSVPGFPECQNMAKLVELDKPKLLNAEYVRCVEHIRALNGKMQELPKSEAMQAQVMRLRYRQMAEIMKVPIFVELVREYIEAGSSVILFVWFDETLKELCRLLKTDCYINGSQKADHRKYVLNKIKNDKARVVVCNMQAGGTAIDGLQDFRGTYPRIGIHSPGDNAVITKQALGRIHRSNSKSKSMNVLVYAAETIEEKVYENVKNKLHNIDLLNDGDLADPLTFTV